MGIDRLRLLLEAGRPDLIRDLRDPAKLADVIALVLPAAEQGLIGRVVDDRLAGEHPPVVAAWVSNQRGVIVRMGDAFGRGIERLGKGIVDVGELIVRAKGDVSK
jgi:hypothetical protein